MASKKGSKSDRAKSPRNAVKNSPLENAQTLAELRRQLAESAKELQDCQRQLAEALEHQAATSEVLGIISRSPTDVQPVLDAIVESAARVCGIDDVVLRFREGNMSVTRAHFGSMPLGRVESVSTSYIIVGCASMARSMFTMFERRTSSPTFAAEAAALAHVLGRSPSSAGRTHWNAERASQGGVPLHSNGDQTPRNLRRPSGDRHRERAVVPRAQRIFRTADSDE